MQIVSIGKKLHEVGKNKKKHFKLAPAEKFTQSAKS